MFGIPCHSIRFQHLASKPFRQPNEEIDTTLDPNYFTKREIVEVKQVDRHDRTYGYKVGTHRIGSRNLYYRCSTMNFLGMKR